jgi:hypothetical protein
VPFLLLFWTLFASATAVLGVWYSVNSATPLRATVATLSTMLGLTLAPWLTLFCCGLLARGGPGEGMALLASIQAGLSPPVSLALMAVHGDEFRSGDRLGGYLAAGVMVGGIVWLFLTSALWAATVKRFKDQTGRDGWQPEQMPPHQADSTT